MEKKKTCQECEKGHNLFYENLEKGETTLKQQMKMERWGKSKDEENRKMKKQIKAIEKTVLYIIE